MILSTLTHLVLIDAAGKGVILVALAIILSLMMHRTSASARHMLWSMTMLALLLLPVLSGVLPAWQVLPRWASVPVEDAAQQPESIRARESQEGRTPPALAGPVSEVTGEPP